MAQSDKSDEEKTEKLTPWVFGVSAIVIFLFATYLNYGGSLHWGSSTDVSATTVAPPTSDR